MLAGPSRSRRPSTVICGDRRARLGAQPADEAADRLAQLVRRARRVRELPCAECTRSTGKLYRLACILHRGATAPYPDRYKWIALSNATLAVLLATLDGSITIIAMPDIFRGIHLDPLVPGELVLPAVDDPRLPRGDQRPDRQPRAARRHGRPRADLQPRLRDLHGRLAAAGHRLDGRPGRRRVPDRLPDRAGHRRRLPARQRGGDHHRRVPRAPARDGARHQQHRRRQRHVHRPRARRRAGPDRLAPGVPDLGPGRHLRDRLGLRRAARAEHAAAGADRLAGQPHVRARPDPRHDLGHVRHPPGRRTFRRLGEPARARPAGRRARLPASPSW